MRVAIEARGITKKFGQTHALRGVDLEVPEGTILGLLGPNGAGKTTMVRILATLERPDSGYAVVDGCDVQREARTVRRRIGLTGQFAAVDEDISGKENLYLIGRLLNLSGRQARARAAELLEQFGLTKVAGKSAHGYSGGMRRRLDLAMSLVGEPRVLYLDEPTTGLDPRSRNDFWALIRSLTGQGVTILLTTQYMEEAEALADSVTVLRDGQVIAAGPPGELRARVGGQVLHVRPADPANLPVIAAALAGTAMAGTAMAGTAMAGTAMARAGMAGAGTAGAGMAGTAMTETAMAGPGTTGTGLACAGLAPRIEADTVALPVAEDWQLTRALRAVSGTGVAIASVETRVPSLDEVFLTLTSEPAELVRESA